MIRDIPIRKVLAVAPVQWWPDRLMIGAVTQLGAAAQGSACDLYNNSTTGEYLTLLDFQLIPGAAGQVLCFPTVLVPIPLSGNGQNVDLLQPQRSGFLHGANAATTLATNYYTIEVGAGGYQWNKDYELARIPPGYAWRFFLNLANTALTLSALWLVEPGPDKAN